MDLLKRYRQLPATVRRGLQLWSIYHQEMGRNQFAKLAAELNSQTSNRFAISVPEMKAAYPELIRDVLVSQSKQIGDLVVSKELHDYIVQDAIQEQTFEVYATFVQSKYSTNGSYGYYSSSFWNQRIRDLRIAFYRSDLVKMREIIRYESINLTGSENSANVLNPFNLEIFNRLALDLQKVYLENAFSVSFLTGFGCRELMQLASSHPFDLSDSDGPLVAALGSILLASGDGKALQDLATTTNGKYPELIASQSFLAGNIDQAFAEFEAALKAIRVATKRKKVAIDGLAGVIHALLYFRQNSTAARKKISDIADVMQQSWTIEYEGIASLLKASVEFQANKTTLIPFSGLIHSRFSSNPNLLIQWIAFYLWNWLVPETPCPISVATLQTVESKYRSLGFQWLQTEAARQLAKLKAMPQNTSDTPEDVLQTEKNFRLPSLLGLIQAEPVWHRPLNALRELAQSKDMAVATAKKSSSERLIWELYIRDSEFQLVPYIQKNSKTGWSVGQRVALKRIYENQTDAGSIKCLTDQDRSLCQALQPTTEFDGYGRYPETVYKFEARPAATALIGHPHIFASGDRDNPLEIVERTPYLQVKRHRDGVRICLDPIPGAGDVLFTQESLHRIAVCIFSTRHREMQRIIGNELIFPNESLPSVVETLGSIAALIPIHSEISGMASAGASVEADPRSHLHLSRKNDGMTIQLYVKPFGSDGPFYRPGIGSKNVMTEIQGKALSTERSLTDERSRVRKLLDSCPGLITETTDQIDFELDSIDEALELMLQLKPLVDSQEVTAHWLHGKSLRVASEASSSMMKLHIKKDRDWFAASGELKVDQGLTVDMMKLIELVEASPSRFVALDDEQFLALTDELRRKLRQLSKYSEHQKNKLRFPSSRMAVLEEIGEGFSVRADAHWKECVERWKSSNEMELKLPDTFQGDLRDYQMDGFRWLGRLAAWGVGACLADDMGLGKTIQALALLLHRAAGGPALVVAPTSVCFNWIREANRFAPTLNVKQFGGGNRDAFFKDLGPRDLVVSSYGLLNSEAERFQKIAWHSLLLDEAQAIKNFATKRSQAAMSLPADYRIIMTGTPLENHLGEVWNLFHFINPGLLGSLEQFQKQFAIPIERDRCRTTQGLLKRLIQPFILRRTKTQVLDELPSRTEVTVHIEMSEDEKLLYEAIRQRAVAKITEAQSSAKNGESQYLQILAEIMKLRRACCHPRLVLEESGLSSAKLIQFSETIDELIENRHKVLVFSQFVGHLAILRAELERKKVAYQYLDGGTPAKERQVRVDAFQSGVGEVFLISLKAGGTGLNLTAADYVIHMDPWWNPAVEDQASDRAHRMGQKRPVTIYRFVCRGTIEERILELHAHKRDLADGLLEGSEISGKLSSDELMRLITNDG